MPKIVIWNKVNDLDIFVDCKLNFQKHIEYVSNSAFLKCRQLLRCFRFTNVSLYFKLYNVYVQPLLNYGCEVYNPNSKRLIKLLEMPLKFYSRRVYQRCNVSNTSYDDRLAQSNQKSIQHQRILQILRTYHNILSGEYHFPDVSALKNSSAIPDSFFPKFGPFQLLTQLLPTSNPEYAQVLPNFSNSSVNSLARVLPKP
uniref:Uncharacterized protein B0403.1 n=1 Tax=Caenorhabditis elegans TaxID=6239 RepID=YWV1_CAEEL|nr:RecName: Full=Uncharacterized protein B0403.1 [Caenorhabditis elegans]